MSVALISERILFQGDKYYIPGGSFHSNNILFDSQDITFTCVYTYNHKDDNSPNVVGLSNNEEYAESDPVKLSRDKVRELITLARANL